MKKKISDEQKLQAQRLQKIVDLLKFVISLDDREILNSTLESVIESLEEEINK